MGLAVLGLKTLSMTAGWLLNVACSSVSAYPSLILAKSLNRMRPPSGRLRTTIFPYSSADCLLLEVRKRISPLLVLRPPAGISTDEREIIPAKTSKVNPYCSSFSLVLIIQNSTD